MFRRSALWVWGLLDRVYNAIPVRFLCTHHWKITSIETEDEHCRFLVRMSCPKCGSTSEHRRP